MQNIKSVFISEKQIDEKLYFDKYQHGNSQGKQNGKWLVVCCQAGSMDTFQSAMVWIQMNFLILPGL